MLSEAYALQCSRGRLNSDLLQGSQWKVTQHEGGRTKPPECHGQQKASKGNPGVVVDGIHQCS